MDPLIPDDASPEQVMLLFELVPDSLTIRYNGRELEVTETTVTPDDGSTRKAFSVELMDGSAVYEIDAVWSSGWKVEDPVWYYTRRNAGKACYGFYIEDAD